MASRTAASLGISGQRVLLRPLTEDDLASIEPPYREALALAAHDTADTSDLRRRLDEARADAAAELLVITLTQTPSLEGRGQGEGQPIGLLEYRLDSPAEGWLTIGFVAVAAALRGLGYGSEAVRLLEEEALRRGLATRFRAEVQPANGLCLYFWLRLGYRPARPEANARRERLWPSGRAEGTISMVRSADASSLSPQGTRRR